MKSSAHKEDGGGPFNNHCVCFSLCSGICLFCDLTDMKGRSEYNNSDSADNVK